MPENAIVDVYRREDSSIDLFSCLYDRKWSKTLPIHVRKRSYVSVPNCMYACVFYALVLHGGGRSNQTVRSNRTMRPNVTRTKQAIHRSFLGNPDKDVEELGLKD